MPEPKVEIYVTPDGKYRWRLKDPKGKIIAVSEEAYMSKEDAENSWELAVRIASEATLVDLTNSYDRLQTARELIMMHEPTIFELKPDYLTVLDRDLIALKTADGKIVLYESAE